ncbi:glutaredoxin-like domain-containing protein [Seiridium cupressi]|uniref:Glutaredoxin-like protein n=1 Tax=Seiridium unicorne TaxID=138068 RepID=A0ABR2UUY3_9PEZI
MHVTSRLLQHACRITLFTRENCGLCGQAKSVLSDVWDQRPFEYREVDIIKSQQVPRWRDLYEFDVPVIHIDKAAAPEEQPKLASKAAKLMHRFTVEEVQAKMDNVEKARE